jgi:pyruvate dehydrogenase E1 component alpha subunit
MHMFSREKNFFGGHGIVGAQVPIGTGSPSPSYTRERRSASPISATARSTRAKYTRASTWRRYGSCRSSTSIENNRYGMGTSVSRASARTDSVPRGVAYGIPGEQVDGMDVVAVHVRPALAPPSMPASGRGRSSLR